MRKLDYRFGKLYIKGKVNTATEEGRASIRKVALEFNFVLQKQREEKKCAEDGEEYKGHRYEFAFMDESYIKQHHRKLYGWYPCLCVAGKTPHRRKRKQKKNEKAGAEGGELLVMIHACTSSSLLHDPDVELDTTDAEVLAKTPKNTCEMLFAAKAETDDYHKNMYGDKFEHWVRYRLLPTWYKLHPDKSMVLVLDNAKYHHYGSTKINKKKSYSKMQAARKIKELYPEWTEVPVPQGASAGTVPFPLSEEVLSKRVFPGKEKKYKGHTLETLYAHLEAYAEEKPETQMPVLAQILRKENQDKGLDHRIIWTTPYESWMQPMEKVWAQDKDYVARTPFDGRKDIPGLRRRAQQGFYGNETLSPPLHTTHPHDPIDVSKLYRWTLKKFNEWIAQDNSREEHPGCLQVWTARTTCPFFVV